MTKPIQLLDVVALTEDLPQRGLSRGQVGTVVEMLAPRVFEVEFCDDDGRAYASSAVHAEQLLVLQYRLVRCDRPANEGLVEFLLACPEKGFFRPIPSESTDTL